MSQIILPVNRDDAAQYIGCSVGLFKKYVEPALTPVASVSYGWRRGQPLFKRHDIDVWMETRKGLIPAVPPPDPLPPVTEVATEPGFVYCVEAAGLRRVKIGFTTGTVAKRMKSLQTACPVGLTLLGYVRGNQRLEGQIHRDLKAYRSSDNTEWFYLTPEVIEYLERQEFFQSDRTPVCPKTISTETPDSSTISG